jgi:hypothetical protein
LPFYGAVIMEVVIEDCENESNKKSNWYCSRSMPY